MKNIIIFYENFYKDILKASLNDNIQVLAWIPSDNISYGIDFIKEHIPLFSRKNFTVCLMLTRLHSQNTLRQFLSILDINNDQILDIYQLYQQHLPIRFYQQIMESSISPLDGLIFGISHGCVGILEDALPGNVRNFCYSSQDIYFNTKILSLLIEEYYDFVSHIKYILFDMFDYTYFNFDTILSNECENYLLGSGFLCEERSPWNKAKNVSDINHTLTQLWSSRTSSDDLATFNSIFPRLHCPNTQEYATEYYQKNHCKTIFPEDALAAYTAPTYPCFSSIQRQVFESTIQFQVGNFKRFLELSCRLKPDIPIIGVLLPKYYIVEQTEQLVNQIWKPQFENMIASFQQQFPNLFLWDLKNFSEISQNHCYYQDLTHLNYDGACCLTTHLTNRLHQQFDIAF